MTKVCFKCKTQKPLNDFYRHPAMSDGYLGKCKRCAKSDAKANRDKDLESARAKDRSRYQCSPGRRAAIAKRASDWRGRFPHKYAAHTAVSNAVRDGRLNKPSSCSDCKQPSDVIHGHHNDYSRPLDVVWLCPVCHAKRHH